MEAGELVWGPGLKKEILGDVSEASVMGQVEEGSGQIWGSRSEDVTGRSGWAGALNRGTAVGYNPTGGGTRVGEL